MRGTDVGRPSCRERILDAAEAVVMECGGARMTLDAVAEKAGVSKGGLLYHFPSKELLHQGMVERLIAHGLKRRERMVAALPPGASRALKAEIRSMLVDREVDDRVSAGLLAAAASEPQLLSTIRDFNRQRFEAHMGRKSEQARQALALLAAYGLFLIELLQISPFEARQRSRLIEELLRFAEESTQSAS